MQQLVTLKSVWGKAILGRYFRKSLSHVSSRIFSAEERCPPSGEVFLPGSFAVSGSIALHARLKDAPLPAFPMQSLFRFSRWTAAGCVLESVSNTDFVRDSINVICCVEIAGNFGPLVR